MNYHHDYLSDLMENPSRSEPVWRPSEEDICALQHAIQQLEWIASGKTPSRNCDLGDGPNKATIRHAMMHAENALKRLKPLNARLLEAFKDAAMSQSSPNAADSAGANHGCGKEAGNGAS